MFRGKFEHNIDEKGRVAIPAKFRERVLNSGSHSLIVTIFDSCLAVYTAEEWKKLETKMAQLEQLDPNVRAFLRYFIAGAMECPLDKSGRILLPSNLREFAGIEKDCVIVGQLTKFEIWNKQRWDNVFTTITNDFNSLTSTLSKLGMNL